MKILGLDSSGIVASVAIVEDDDSYAETLQEYLNKYEQENEVRFQVVRYEDGADLVEKYHGDFDILIMDIELKFMDGMTQPSISVRWIPMLSLFL